MIFRSVDCVWTIACSEARNDALLNALCELALRSEIYQGLHAVATNDVGRLVTHRQLYDKYYFSLPVFRPSVFSNF